MQTLAAAERLTVTSNDGTPIALWKSGAGPSLLVVHGTCADHTAWGGCAGPLAHPPPYLPLSQDNQRAG